MEFTVHDNLPLALIAQKQKEWFERVPDRHQERLKLLPSTEYRSVPHERNLVMERRKMKDAIQLFVDQLHEQSMRRWKAGSCLGSTLKAHCIAYFVPNPLSVAFLKQSGMTDAEKLITLYKAAVEASRLQWEGYSDAQAQRVYDEWLASNAINQN